MTATITLTDKWVRQNNPPGMCDSEGWVQEPYFLVTYADGRAPVEFEARWCRRGNLVEAAGEDVVAAFEAATGATFFRFSDEYEEDEATARRTDNILATNRLMAGVFAKMGEMA